MIELKRLKLINWHNFENTTFDCARLTYMIGVNAVGKTTILDAIRYCLTTNRNFNALGNKKSGRTLQGSVHAKQRGENAYRRPGHTVAYIGAEFWDSVKHTSFVIAVRVESEGPMQELHPGDQTWYISEDGITLEKLPFIDPRTGAPSAKEDFKPAEGRLSYTRSPSEARDRICRALGIGRAASPLGKKFNEVFQMGTSMDEIPNFREFLYQYILPQPELDLEALQGDRLELENLHAVLAEAQTRADALDEIVRFGREATEKQTEALVNRGAALLARAAADAGEKAVWQERVDAGRRQQETMRTRYAEAKTAFENGNGVAWANDNTEVIAFSIENPGYVVGIPSLGSADTIAPAVTKGNTTLLNWLNDEIKALGNENFFHADYEATLLDTYGKDYEDTLVVEGGAAAGAEAAETVTKKGTITVAASPTPHAEILAEAAKLLAKEGWTLEVTEFEDYVQPNLVVDSGEIDANYFQHTPYLDDFNEKKGTDLVAVAAIHYEPFGIYPGTKTALSDLADGDVIAVPNDTTNEARALLLLQDNGVIKLADGAGLAATVKDIVENPHNVKIQELEAAQVSRVKDEVAFVVLNGNYALQAGFSVAHDAVAYETSASAAAKTYANVLVVKAGNENNEGVQALVKVLKSDEIKQFINDTYDGAVIPFED